MDNEKKSKKQLKYMGMYYPNLVYHFINLKHYIINKNINNVFTDFLGEN